MAHPKAAALTEPGMGSLHAPAEFAAPHFASTQQRFRLLFLRLGAINLMARFCNRSRCGSESYPESANTRFGCCRGETLERGSRTCSGVANASATSAGEALSSRTPSGRP